MFNVTIIILMIYEGIKLYFIPVNKLKKSNESVTIFNKFGIYIYLACQIISVASIVFYIIKDNYVFSNFLTVFSLWGFLGLGLIIIVSGKKLYIGYQLIDLDNVREIKIDLKYKKYWDFYMNDSEKISLLVTGAKAKRLKQIIFEISGLEIKEE